MPSAMSLGGDKLHWWGRQRIPPGFTVGQMPMMAASGLSPDTRARRAADAVRPASSTRMLDPTR
jgi:hypothetical protein